MGSCRKIPRLEKKMPEDSVATVSLKEVPTDDIDEITIAFEDDFESTVPDDLFELLEDEDPLVLPDDALTCFELRSFEIEAFSDDDVQALYAKMKSAVRGEDYGGEIVCLNKTFFTMAT
jgi:hypothetical protein